MKCTVSVAVSRPYLLEVIFNDGAYVLAAV